MWGRGSKFLILREHKAQCPIVGYFGVFPYWVYQEYSIKRDYVFSLLFFHDHAPFINGASDDFYTVKKSAKVSCYVHKY